MQLFNKSYRERNKSSAQLESKKIRPEFYQLSTVRQEWRSSLVGLGDWLSKQATVHWISVASVKR